MPAPNLPGGTRMDTYATPTRADPAHARAGLILIAAITALRVVSLTLSPLALGPDEAQYWRWADALDWGYWSKPPLVAWAIHVTTAVFGDAEWAIRLSAPLAHGVGAALVLRLAQEMAGGRAGLLAGLTYLLMPGVTLSSTIMSTDGLLLPLWTLGLWSAWRLRSGRQPWLAAILLGLALGTGMLAKYAMIYFLIGLAILTLVDAPMRRALVSLRGLIVLALAGALIAPHLAWNAANSFKTISHTAENARWGASLLHPEHILTFLTDQMGVFGPIAFLALLGGLAVHATGARAWWLEPRARFLTAFILPALSIILVQAVISRAHANWAATAYPAASVLIVLWLSQAGRSRAVWLALVALIAAAAMTIPGLGLSVRATIALLFGGCVLALAAGHRFRLSGLLPASIALHVLLAAAFITLTVLPARTVDALGLANAYKRVRAWPETTQAVLDAAHRHGASAVLVDEREVYHGLDYYGRDSFDLPLRTWRVEDGAKSYAEEFPLRPGEDSRVLIAVTKPGYMARMRGDFASFEPVGELVIPLGGGKERRFSLFLASGFAPVPRDRAAPLG